MTNPTSQSTSADSVEVTRLSCGYPTGLLGLPGSSPSLSWQLAASTPGLEQTAYEIQCSSDEGFQGGLSSTGEITSNLQLEMDAPGGELASREIRYYRVRVQTSLGWTNWSQALQYEAGLLTGDEFVGEAIGDDSSHSKPATLLRKEFEVSSKPHCARLYATGHGLFEFSVNGIQVAPDEFLNPGWTAYQARLNVATFDVTNLIMVGQNALGVVLGDGWFRGKLGFMNKYNNYGEHTSVLLQLEITYPDGKRQIVASDDSFKASQGELRFGDIYDGCVIDLNYRQKGWDKPSYEDTGWTQAVVRELDKSSLMPRIAEPIKKIQEFPMTITSQADRVLLSASQNIAGWVRLVVQGKKGQTVVVRHAEVLEPDQKLHTKALRSAKATDTYVLDRDGRHTLEPRFTFHGFQYADVVSEAEVISGVAVAISSDLKTRGTFTSSDTRLNRLHENVVWSQRDNFVGVPTDCPQRDERLGWTGDAQAFSYAANTLVDVQSFWRSWLIDLELDQDDEGNVAAVVPDIVSMQPNPTDDWEVMGRAGWADAATIVPWSIYETFGTTGILAQQLNSMRRWTDALDNRRAGSSFLPTEFQFGDWCDPDAPGDQPWLSKVSADFVANSFFAHTAELTAKTEALVGSPDGVKKYQEMADKLKADIWEQMGDEAMGTTAGCSIALEFEICPAEERSRVADKLSQMVRVDNGRITTGFLGTPLILHALSKAGHIEEAYLMLMRREIRSWLYQVDSGATTIWERWDAIMADGSINAGAMATESEHQDDASMISFNHYAYGAVVDWVYRNVAGLAPVESDPGYRTSLVSPKPAAGFSFASASINTGFGELAIHWEIMGSGDLVARLKVPFGVNAVLELPVSIDSEMTANGERVSNGTSLGYGDHVIVVSNPLVVEYK